jgi:hypothetical protein
MEKYIVRVYDGMDGCWCDCTKAVTLEEATKYWNSRTNNGTIKTKYSDIDYYKIFPANTKMLYDSDSCDR